MKTLKWLALITALLALAETVSAQEPFLPIGENINSHIKTIEVGLFVIDDGAPYSYDGSYDHTVNWVTISYTPSMGTPKAVTEAQIAEWASNFTPPKGKEKAEYEVTVDTYTEPWARFNNRPALVSTAIPSPFHLVQDAKGKWKLPDSALKVSLTYGYSFISYYLPWVTEIEAVLRNNIQEKRYSSRNGVPESSGCKLADDKSGIIYLSWRYASDEPDRGWWTSGELILHGVNDTWVSVNVLNGIKIAESNPPPYPIEKATPLTSHIAKLTRIGNVTEIVVEGKTGDTVTVEFAEKIGEWETVTSTPLTISSAGRKIFTHTSSSSNGFYRLRSDSAAPPKQ